jgi:hypothetical protein
MGAGVGVGEIMAVVWCRFFRSSEPACFVGSTGSGSHSLAHCRRRRTDRQTQALKGVKAANTRRRRKASVHLDVSEVETECPVDSQGWRYEVRWIGLDGCVVWE